MESWLPWLTTDEHLLPDLLPADALVALVEPRRLRDRAQELLDEERALASTLASTWGLGGERTAGLDAEGHSPEGAGRKEADVSRDLPRLSLPFDRLLAHTRAGAVPVLATPDNPSTEQLAATAFDPVVGDTEALARRLNALRADGFRVFIAADGCGSAERIAQLIGEEGVTAAIVARVDDTTTVLRPPGVYIAV